MGITNYNTATSPQRQMSPVSPVTLSHCAQPWTQNPSQHSRQLISVNQSWRASLRALCHPCLLFLQIFLQQSYVEERGVFLQQPRWELMLTLWAVMITEMDLGAIRRRICELDDKLEMWGEVRWEVVSMTWIPKKTGRKPSLRRTIIYSIFYILSVRHLWCIQKKSEANGWASNSRT